MSAPAADRDAPGRYDHDPAPRPALGPLDVALRVVKVVASLRLTVTLFALSILLVFFGTVSMMESGIWTTVYQYMWSWYVMVPVDLFRQFGVVFLSEWFPKDGRPWPGAFPFPAGKLLGGLMLVNLVAAHLVRFRLTWKRSGILLIHSGLILLFVGEAVTREYAVEQRMIIPEGQAVGFTQDARLTELALVDGSGADDKVVVVPEALLRKGGRVAHPDLPVDIGVEEYMPNSSLADAAPGRPNRATDGIGRTVTAAREREVPGADAGERSDVPAAYVTLYEKGTDRPLGTYLGQVEFKPQPVTVGGATYDLSLRYKRYYKPYTVRLEKFRFDRYPGTNQPRNYSSQVVLSDPGAGVERGVTIRMNSPLRHAGETLYQGGFDPRTETTTILQVVDNPGWRIPYASCVLVTVGMLVHFGIALNQFLLRRGAAA